MINLHYLITKINKFNIKRLNLKINKKNISLMNDLIKYPFIIFIIYIFIVLTTENKKIYRIFSKIFISLIIAICLYHSIINKIFKLEIK